jgi:RNA polymerase sigma-70 factor (ECF subfamily)
VKFLGAATIIPVPMERVQPLVVAEVEARPTFDAVYRQWFHQVVRWAHALGGPRSDLDDVAQEVFLVVRRKLGAFDGRNLPAWLFRITSHVSSAHRRRAWFRRVFRGHDERFDELRSVGDPSTELERKQRQEILYRILDRISEKRRTVFVLFEVEELSGEQIAELLDIPLATVWTRLHHARKELARLAAEASR